MQTWCENAETFQGFWVTRTSTLALIDLFASARPSLQALQVKGDLIVKPETKDGTCGGHSIICDEGSLVYASDYDQVEDQEK